MEGASAHTELDRQDSLAAYVAFGLVRHEWTVPLGPLDKLIELALIALLWREERQAQA